MWAWYLQFYNFWPFSHHCQNLYVFLCFCFSKQQLVMWCGTWGMKDGLCWWISLFLYRNRSWIGRESFLLWNASRVGGQRTKSKQNPLLFFFSLCHFRKFLLSLWSCYFVELFGQIPTIRQAHWLLPNRVIYMWLEGLLTGFIPQEVTHG